MIDDVLRCPERARIVWQLVDVLVNYGWQSGFRSFNEAFIHALTSFDCFLSVRGVSYTERKGDRETSVYGPKWQKGLTPQTMLLTLHIWWGILKVEHGLQFSLLRFFEPCVTISDKTMILKAFPSQEPTCSSCRINLVIPNQLRFNTFAYMGLNRFIRGIWKFIRLRIVLLMKLFFLHFFLFISIKKSQKRSNSEEWNLWPTFVTKKPK